MSVAAASWLAAICRGEPNIASAVLRGDGLAASHREQLLRWGLEHRLAAVIGGELQARLPVLPEWQHPFLVAWRHALADELLFSELLVALDRAAASAGLAPIVLKGADLARRPEVYAPGQRAHNDLDLLVAPGDLARWERLLVDLGWRCDRPDAERARRQWFALTYRDPSRPRLQIDLHWSLGEPGRGRWQLPQVWERSEPLPGACALRRLGRYDLISHLALHAVAYHAAAGRWIWWLDLARLNADRPDPGLAPDAARRGARIALEAALLRIAELFPRPPSAEAGTAAASRPPRRARWIAACGSRFERGGDRRWKRWSIAALAADPWWELLRSARQVLRRGGSA